MNEPTLDADQIENALDGMNENKDCAALMAKYFAKQLSTVEVKWPLHDGHSVTIIASRQLDKTEFLQVMRLLEMAEPAFVKESEE